MALREDRGFQCAQLNSVRERTVNKRVSSTYILMANYATPQSSSYVLERHSELATGMDMGLGASE